ncbi:MOSC domain-containing protein [Mucilaginibacter boryungensis]|uniref:MOSC domain-containing protein n=1 Tax=Mucilaginibacter boryungensis TaxID=768480 RepID=A0ABR9XF08_9SPHI|nr:MOSC N-terminal beta barrel domain-containing protein [Mucilaginibacter boryungensis]MBE9665972.1 MOSC domain-containing protein [Mucilaginibacter boryungensis]
MLQISALYIYPIKSLGGIILNTAKVTDRGLECDRRWMLIDQNNRFISQREHPEMALLRPSIMPEGLQVTNLRNNSTLLIPYQPLTNKMVEVTVWDDTTMGQLVSSAADEWFSNALGEPCRLVYMPDNIHRPVDPDYAPDGKLTSFSDAYPFLVISQASIDDLSARAGEPIPINRFRPNIVFTGGEPYMEDGMTHFTIGAIDFYGVKICARCPIPGINQNTAQRVKEPLKTMAGYRRKNNKVYLGQNLIHNGEGSLHVGDTITVLDMKPVEVFE